MPRYTRIGRRVGVACDLRDLGEVHRVLVEDCPLAASSECDDLLGAAVGHLRAGPFGVEAVQLFLCAGVSSASNTLALSVACDRGLDDVVELLLACRCDAGAISSRGSRAKPPVSKPSVLAVLLNSGWFVPSDFGDAFRIDDAGEMADVLAQSGLAVPDITGMTRDCLDTGRFENARRLMALEVIDHESRRILEAHFGVKFSSMSSVLDFVDSPHVPDVSGCLQSLSFFGPLACWERRTTCVETLLLGGYPVGLAVAEDF